MLNRRSLITGLVSFAATAPAIVKASSLMPVKAHRGGIIEYWNGKIYKGSIGSYEGVRFLPRDPTPARWVFWASDGELYGVNDRNETFRL